MKRLTIDFITLDDGYGTTQGTAYADGRFLVIKKGRGQFDVLAKISKWVTDEEIRLLVGSDPQAYEKHVEALMRSIEKRD